MVAAGNGKYMLWQPSGSVHRFAAREREISAVERARQVDDIWIADQDSRFSYVIMRLNQVLPIAYVTTQQAEGVA